MVLVFLLLTIKKDALTREIFFNVERKIILSARGHVTIILFISTPKNYKTGLPVQRSVGQL